jgi:hypothetical protein
MMDDEEYVVWDVTNYTSIFSAGAGSNIDKFIPELLEWLNASEKWGTLNNHQLAELVYCSLGAYGIISVEANKYVSNENFIPLVSHIYTHGVVNLPYDERRNIHSLILKDIMKGVTSAVALLPFVIKEPAEGLASTATIDLMACSGYMSDLKVPYGLTELIPLIEKGTPENTGAVFGGLVAYGDCRNEEVLNELKQYLSTDDVQVASRISSGVLFHTTINFWLSWAEELIEDGSDKAMTIFGSAASALVLQKKNVLTDTVIEAERYCPAFKFDNPIKVIRSWTLEEYTNLIASRLYKLEELEDAPKLFSSVLTFWGLEPNAPVAERFNFT